MKFRPNVNFGFAFDQLKDAFLKSEEEQKKAKSYMEGMASTGAILSGTVKSLLWYVEDAETELPEIDKEIEQELNAADDLKNVNI